MTSKFFNNINKLLIKFDEHKAIEICKNNVIVEKSIIKATD